MDYKKEPNAAAIESLLKAVRFTLNNKSDYLVMLDMDEMAFSAGSDRMQLVGFLISCMDSSEEIAQLFLNVVLNYLSNKVMNEVCGTCDKAETCGKKQNACDPETLYNDLKHQMEMALKLTKVGKN